MPTSPQTVAFSAQPNQTGKLVLNIDGTVKILLFALRLNEVAQYWALSLYNAQGALILDSVPLITGNVPAGNVLRQFAYLAIGSLFVVNQSGVAAPDFPNGSDLGTDFTVVWDNTPAA